MKCHRILVSALFADIIPTYRFYFKEIFLFSLAYIGDDNSCYMTCYYFMNMKSLISEHKTFLILITPFAHLVFL